jgi:hypothetical protein
VRGQLAEVDLLDSEFKDLAATRAHDGHATSTSAVVPGTGMKRTCVALPDKLPQSLRANRKTG